MQLITTTELRTKVPQLLKFLEKGNEVKLIHRSKIVGKIIPCFVEKPALGREGIINLEKLINTLNLPHLSYKQRDKIYRKHLEKKYGKGIS
ncbi:hypothetical protein A2382_04185 [Candidatus Woesebacteria bacterium RIFOXYB1_FULL_38_16]|uniref:Antitoxin n=2 Tax=Bacteria candidate phyla TaxID=1783234 RepID=A0A1F8CTY7_9BACT|nr:MAG: hypothetical protein UU80_C0050G0002 [candidate division WWE3 bacterium GW2011_GWA1_41_8]OGM75131.1 MAG: hypothetical protein A2191_04260 [Candidatus Woesebacteria bacterium RIFOXYA1_FULL_38_9]OGM79770.1 MAG: hypothetical protein A2382_04185 [Candidatus Woesebacteria bacterium RIFOXYB1_FULL_38_16]